MEHQTFITELWLQLSSVVGIFFTEPFILLLPLQVLEKGLDSLHVPYAYGFSIILLTLLVKLATYPLTKQQVTKDSVVAVVAICVQANVVESLLANSSGAHRWSPQWQCKTWLQR